MIERKEEIVKAVCDACGASLLHKFSLGPPSLLRGTLKNAFGYGCEPAALDPLGASVVANYDLCGSCFVKACHAVGLPAHDGDLKEKTTSIGDDE